jgi:hypothetical protein
MFVGIDSAARIIWFRSVAIPGPRIRLATRCTLIESPCAFRQTSSFLKSPMAGG